jgi:hypothetical protein
MNLKIRIKTPSGAEFEAEGPAELILPEKEKFMENFSAKTPDKNSEEPPDTAGRRQWIDVTPNHWKAATKQSGDGTYILRIKPYGLRAADAALIILAAENRLKSASETSAIQLSKSVKASGFSPERIDRLLLPFIKDGFVKASGTKRNRTYQITEKGLEKAGLQIYRTLKEEDRQTTALSDQKTENKP